MSQPLPTQSARPRPSVVLETTLLLHGVPREAAPPLAARLQQAVTDAGAVPRLVGVVDGRPVVGLSDEQLDHLLRQAPRDVRKVNSANLGAALFRRASAATTVSTTMELAAAAGVSVFATGALGGVHHPTPGSPLDISADLFALTRFPVAVVTSGVKSILDVAGTRELLETLGVPVVGYQTSDFPAFYRRTHTSPVNPVDERFDDVGELARFVRFELARTNRAVVVCSPIPAQHEIAAADWTNWLQQAEAKVESHANGRDATPEILAALHEVSGGATLRANIELAVQNASVAGEIAARMATR